MIDIDIRCNKCLEPIYDNQPTYCLECYEAVIKKFAREKEKNRELKKRKEKID